jgi:hypothetical protein
MFSLFESGRKMSGSGLAEGGLSGFLGILLVGKSLEGGGFGAIALVISKNCLLSLDSGLLRKQPTVSLGV